MAHQDCDKCAVPPTRSRGRPKQLSEDQRRQRLIDAAEDVFLQLGFQSASMDDIAHAAAMSKKTLYQLFGSKEELFGEMIHQRCDSTLVMPPDGPDNRDAFALLYDMLLKGAKIALSARQVAIYRLVVVEAPRQPALARMFIEGGPNRGRALLGDLLVQLQARGDIEIDQPVQKAEMLLHIVFGSLHMRLLLNDIEPPSEPEIEAHVAQSIRLFLNGVIKRR